MGAFFQIPETPKGVCIFMRLAALGPGPFEKSAAQVQLYKVVRSAIGVLAQVGKPWKA